MAGWTPAPVVCAHCSVEFQPATRKRGGGAVPLYCGRRCVQAAYTARNHGKKLASNRAYASSDKGQRARSRKSARARYGKYGWTREQFLQELDRQGSRCLGCSRVITEKSGVIDHDHVSGKVRGILCQRCNHVLGHAMESRETLRQLSAYLQRDREVPLLYLSGSLRNPRIPVLAEELRGYGIDVVDDWFAAGPEADDYWQAYEKGRGRSFGQALRGRAAEHVALFDRAFISVADFVGAVLPAGKSTMLEVGYAAMLGKTTFLLTDNEEPERYDVMPQVVDIVVPDVRALVSALGLDKGR